MKISTARRRRIILYCILLLGILFLLVQKSEASEYEANFETIPAVDKSPLRVGTWKSPPTVVVCDPAPISQIHLVSAINFWERLGHTLKLGSYKTSNEKICADETPTGFVVITLVARDELSLRTSLAETRFFVNNYTGKVEWARIALVNDVRPTVLEHELGHALGYLHCDTEEHLMHSKWALTGWKTTGLARKQR